MSILYKNKTSKSNSSKNIFSLSTSNLPKKSNFINFNKNNLNNSKNFQKNQKKLVQFILGKKLGNGAFATVRLATHIKTKEIVAIKIFDKQKLREKDKIQLEREINILKRVKHKNIVNLYNVVNSKNSIYLIMEYIKGIELFFYVNEKKRLSEAEACQYFQQIISGIEYLEKLKIVHRDIKLENIIIENKKNIKIIDFGLSNIYPKNNILFSSCGSPCYASPEMIMGKNYTGSGIDIWSSGIVLFAMLAGYLPFVDNDEQKMYKKIVEGKLYFPQRISNSAKDLLQKLLEKDPLKRISISEIKKHPWFKKGDIKLNMSPGLMMNEIITPIDLDIISLMVNKYGYDEKEIKIDLLKNKHNYTTTTYYILLDAKIKKGETSIADLKSKEYIDYVNNPSNLLSNYNYDINEVIDERIYGNKIEKKFFIKKIKSYNNSPKNLSLLKNDNKENINIKTIKNEKNDNLEIKNKININEIDNNEEYLCVIENKENSENMNKPIKIEKRNNNIKNNKDNSKQKIKKRSMSGFKRHKKNKLVTNSTYFKKLNLKIFNSKEKYENNKKSLNKEKIEINNNVHIINNTNFIKEKINKENIFNNLNNLEKNKNRTINTNINTNQKNKNNNSLSNSKYIKSNKKENEENKIKVNPINKDKRIITKKLINKKTEPFNKTFLNKSNINKYNNIEPIENNSISNIRKNQTFKKQKNINKRTLNINEINKNNSNNNSLKKLFFFENEIINNNLKDKKYYSKKLYVKLNEKYLTIDKNKSIQKNNSKEKKNITINITNDNNNYNEEKENDENNYYYKKMKTIDLKIKELGKKNKNRNECLNNNKIIISNKINKEKTRAESVQERNIVTETNNNNKRLNTDSKNITIKQFNSKKGYKKIKINKRNLFNNSEKNNNSINDLKIYNTTNDDKDNFKRKISFNENKLKVNKENNTNKIIKNKNYFNINIIDNFKPFCLSNILIINNIDNSFESLNNNLLKNNKIKYIKQKNKYIFLNKDYKFEIVFDKMNHDNLYHIKKIIKKSSNKNINELIYNIINSISEFQK